MSPPSLDENMTFEQWTAFMVETLPRQSQQDFATASSHFATRGKGCLVFHRAYCKFMGVDSVGQWQVQIPEDPPYVSTAPFIEHPKVKCALDLYDPQQQYVVVLCDTKTNDVLAVVSEPLSKKEAKRARHTAKVLDFDAWKQMLQCSACGKVHNTTIQRCGACKSAWYCNKECQKNHWNVHKTTCRSK